MSHPIVLVGLPGAGKSTLGPILAARLNRDFLDSDIEIERTTGISVSDHIEQFGEATFRATECEVIVSLIGRDDSVIALGGGALENLQARRAIRRRCTSIWLDPPIDIIAARLADSQSRPLLVGPDLFSALASLLDKRRKYYAQADFRIGAETLGQALDEALAICSGPDPKPPRLGRARSSP